MITTKPEFVALYKALLSVKLDPAQHSILKKANISQEYSYAEDDKDGQADDEPSELGEDIDADKDIHLDRTFKNPLIPMAPQDRALMTRW